MKIATGNNLGQLQAGIFLQGMNVANELGAREAAHKQMLASLIGNFEDEATIVEFWHRILMVRSVRFRNDIYSVEDLGVGRIVAFFGKVHLGSLFLWGD